MITAEQREWLRRRAKAHEALAIVLDRLALPEVSASAARLRLEAPGIAPDFKGK
jgi:hypothetical protein